MSTSFANTLRISLCTNVWRNIDHIQGEKGVWEREWKRREEGNKWGQVVHENKVQKEQVKKHVYLFYNSLSYFSCRLNCHPFLNRVAQARQEIFKKIWKNSRSVANGEDAKCAPMSNNPKKCWNTGITGTNTDFGNTDTGGNNTGQYRYQKSLKYRYLSYPTQKWIWSSNKKLWREKAIFASISFVNGCRWRCYFRHNILEYKNYLNFLPIL